MFEIQEKLDKEVEARKVADDMIVAGGGTIDWLDPARELTEANVNEIHKSATSELQVLNETIVSYIFGRLKEIPKIGIPATIEEAKRLASLLGRCTKLIDEIAKRNEKNKKKAEDDFLTAIKKAQQNNSWGNIGDHLKWGSDLRTPPWNKDNEAKQQQLLTLMQQNFSQIKANQIMNYANILAGDYLNRTKIDKVNKHMEKLLTEEAMKFLSPYELKLAIDDQMKNEETLKADLPENTRNSVLDKIHARWARLADRAKKEQEIYRNLYKKKTPLPSDDAINVYLKEITDQTFTEAFNSDKPVIPSLYDKMIREQIRSRIGNNVFNAMGDLLLKRYTTEFMTKMTTTNIPVLARLTDKGKKHIEDSKVYQFPITPVGLGGELV